MAAGEKAYRVYWSRNEVIDNGGGRQSVKVIKEVREGLSFDDAQSLAQSLTASGFLPFVTLSVRARHESV